MGHAFERRATSLGVSVLLTGAALIAALGATHHVFNFEPPSAPTPTIIGWTPPTPPVDPPPPQPTSPHPMTTDVIDAAPLTPYTAPNNFADPVGAVGTIGPVQITDPRWLHEPRDLERFYPARAISREIEGRAVLDCAVSVVGALSCVVVSETPANWGFGAAALRIAREYAMAPATIDGAPAPGRYRMDVPFTLR